MPVTDFARYLHSHLEISSERFVSWTLAEPELNQGAGLAIAPKQRQQHASGQLNLCHIESGLFNCNSVLIPVLVVHTSANLVQLG